MELGEVLGTSAARGRAVKPAAGLRAAAGCGRGAAPEARVALCRGGGPHSGSAEAPSCARAALEPRWALAPGGSRLVPEVMGGARSPSWELATGRPVDVPTVGAIAWPAHPPWTPFYISPTCQQPFLS